jgi:hypothetical protein
MKTLTDAISIVDDLYYPLLHHGIEAFDTSCGCVARREMSCTFWLLKLKHLFVLGDLRTVHLW